MDSEEIKLSFQAKSPLYARLKEEALFILESVIRKTDIKLHSTSSRTKTVESFLDKVQRRDLKKPFEEMSDIVGIRIVCLFLSDINRIAQLIRDAFAVVSEDNKVEGTDVSSFGYLSVHFIVTMKSEYAGPRYQGISKIPFEIQVRTIAMDAWANVSHYLDYKSDQDVPDDLKRDFYALSGLFYVADKHFEMSYGSSKRSQAQMSEFFDEATPQEKAQQEINLDSLKAFMRKRFPEREETDASSLSSLIRELLALGYKTIGDIDRLLDQTEDAFLLYEQEHPPSTAKDRKFFDVGVIRVSTELKHRPTQYRKYQELLKS